MNKLKIKLSGKEIIAIFLCFAFLFAPITPLTQKADAFLGINFSITLKDIQRYAEKVRQYAKEVFFVRLKKRMLTQIQNDLVNFVQNGGVPRFIKNPGDFLTGAAETATVSALDEVFGAEGIDICSPFKMNVNLMVNETALIPEYGARCTLGDIADNLGKFSIDFNEGGGWNTWIKVHENNLPLVYFTINDRLIWKMEQEGNAAIMQVTAGNGFLDQKICHELSVNSYKGRTALELKFGIQSSNPDLETAVGDLAGINFVPEQLTSAQLLDAINLAITQGIEEPMVPLSDGTKKPFLQAFDPIEGSRTTIGSELLGEGITMDKIPKSSLWNAKCTDEETITPGKAVGDWVSGGLKSLGIDNIIGSNDIAVILDAVLNAATNRAMQEGLSLVKSGRGTFTTPAKGTAKAVAAQPQTEGLESPAGINIQNQMSDILNKSQKLIKSLEDLGLKQENKETKFETRVKEIMGINYTPLRTRDKDTSLTDVINRLFGKYKDNYLRYETSQNNFISLYKSFGKFSDKSNFNDEANMPSLYFTNKILNSTNATVWKSIKERFSELSERNTYGSKNQCIDVYYTLSPAIVDGDDKLPFIVDEYNRTGWASDDHSYITNLKNTADDRASQYFPINEFILYAVSQINEIEARINNLERISESYDPLIENAGQMIEDLKKDRNTITGNLRNISLYTSLLLDYDREGASTRLIERIKNYNSLMGNGDSLDSEILYAYERLLLVQNSTRIAWKNSQQNIINSSETTTDEKENARIKIGYIEKADNNIKSELAKIKLPANVATDLGIVESEDVKDQEINYSQTGLRLFYALAQAMGIDIEILTSEFDEIQEKINKYQTDISNQLGEQITEKEQMQTASLEGGDTEWEKYYQNRTQLAYALFIRDLYKEHFIDSFCNDEGSGGNYVQPNDPNDVDYGDIPTPTPTPSSNLPTTIKIMAVGDSNTAGGTTAVPDTYRGILSTLLSNDNSTINYLGSSGYVGGGGYIMDDLLNKANVLNEISARKPEVLLLMIGGNDLWDDVAWNDDTKQKRNPISEGAAEAKAVKLKELINLMKTAYPQMKIIVAKIALPTGPKAGQITTLNAFRNAFDSLSLTSLGNVSAVDMIDCQSKSDGVHYTADGYNCVAEKWAEGIRLLYRIAN